MIWKPSTNDRKVITWTDDLKKMKIYSKKPVWSNPPTKWEVLLRPTSASSSKTEADYFPLMLKYDVVLVAKDVSCLSQTRDS